MARFTKENEGVAQEKIAKREIYEGKQMNRTRKIKK